MTTPAAPLLVSTANGVATLTLNRPEVRNALNLDMLEALESAVTRLYHAANVRLIIMQGAGDAFMAGGDIKQFEGQLRSGTPSHHFAGMIARVNNIVQLLRELRQPVIAAVHGACAGFGVSLALAADITIAADTAKFTMAYDRLGLTPDGGVTWQLMQSIGAKRAADFVLTGMPIDAATAERWGMISRVVPEADLQATVEKLGAHLLAGSAQAQAQAKNLVNFAAERTLAAQLEAEAESFAQLTNTDNFAEGVAAFLGKRAPDFKDK